MTERMTQKEIKRFVVLGVAEDITHLSFDACNALRKAHSFTTLNVSTGVYGMNGALFRDENSKLYAITSRTSTLFQMV